MARRPRLLAFLGPVGVGKSTQANLVTQSLKRRGFKVSNTQLKAFHILSSGLAFFVVLLLREKSRGSNLRILWKRRPELSRKLLSLLALLDLPSFVFRYLLFVELPLKCGQVVIVEEYIPATIADYVFLIKKLKSQSRVALGFVALVQKIMWRNRTTAITIFMNASFNSLSARIEARNDYDEEVEYMLMQKSTLINIARTLGYGRFYYIETTDKTALEVRKNLFSIISSEVKSK